jgi:hypothetical protein
MTSSSNLFVFHNVPVVQLLSKHHWNDEDIHTLNLCKRSNGQVWIVFNGGGLR